MSSVMQQVIIEAVIRGSAEAVERRTEAETEGVRDGGRFPF